MFPIQHTPFTTVFSALAAVLVNCAALINAASVSAADEPGSAHHEYSGALIQPGDGDGQVLRRFEVQTFDSPVACFFHLSDDLRQGCPWPDSFGLTGPSTPQNQLQPHLLYPYDGTPWFLTLPPLKVALPAEIQPGHSWSQNGWQLSASETSTIENVQVWQLEAREPRGRRQSLQVDAATGILIKAEADIFMGQGDQFLLTLVRSGTRKLPENENTAVNQTQKALLQLQTALGRRPDAQLAELSQRQIGDSVAALEELAKLATGTALERLVRQIRADVEIQKKRLESAAGRAASLMSSQAPAFKLNLTAGGTLDSESLKGRTVILHFWDYKDSPLSEPYGQTGYLEFLYNRRRTQNLQVVGVSTNADLQVPENLARGRRAARKIAEFMNLSYPIGYDDGTLLKTFGDPRESRGQLPLWIVIGADGKVRHYHPGYYEIDAAQGLKELEAVLNEDAGK
ncbi:MAG: peroxiredoxin family protein [Planctomycetaceae bacterium]